MTVVARALLQNLNNTFNAAYKPKEPNLEDIVGANLDIFGVFNRTLFT